MPYLCTGVLSFRDEATIHKTHLALEQVFFELCQHPPLSTFNTARGKNQEFDNCIIDRVGDYFVGGLSALFAISPCPP